MTRQLLHGRITHKRVISFLREPGRRRKPQDFVMKLPLVLLVLLSSSSCCCQARYLVPVELCYPSSTAKRCGVSPSSSGGGDGNAANCSRIARSVLRGAGRGGSSTVVGVTNPMTMTSSKMKLLNLLSGGAAGTIASCITNPLEVIKIQLQSSSAAVGELAIAGATNPISIGRTIFAKDGILGFWKGMKPTLIGIIPGRSVYFFSYEQTKRYLPKFGMIEGGTPNSLLSGLAAGVSAQTLTNPIWMVKSRLQLLADNTAGQRSYTGYSDAIKSIYREEGLGGFYKGISASYWGCFEGAIQFMLYEKIKKKLVSEQNVRRDEKGLPHTDKLSNLSYFLSAAISKCTASIITYPHEVARTRVREQARNGIFKYNNGMWQTIGVVAKEEGWKGLYGGMGMHLMKVVPNTAIMFLTYEVVNSWLGRFTVIED